MMATILAGQQYGYTKQTKTSEAYTNIYNNGMWVQAWATHELERGKRTKKISKVWSSNWGENGMSIKRGDLGRATMRVVTLAENEAVGNWKERGSTFRQQP